MCLAAQHGGGPWKLKQLRHQMRRRQRLGGRGTDRWRDAAVRRRHDPDLWDDQLVQPVEVLLGKERGVSHGLCHVAQQVLAAAQLHRDGLEVTIYRFGASTMRAASYGKLRGGTTRSGANAARKHAAVATQYNAQGCTSPRAPRAPRRPPSSSTRLWTT